MHYPPEHAREALQYIDPGQDRHGWVRTLAAAKAAGLDLDDVCAWSAAAPNFKSERDVSDAWRSIDPSGSVQAGTLFHMARQGGWKPAQSERRSPPVRVQAQTRREPPRPAIRPGMSACEVWDAAEPATNAHPYIARKGGRPDGLRVCAGGASRPAEGSQSREATTPQGAGGASISGTARLLDQPVPHARIKSTP